MGSFASRITYLKAVNELENLDFMLNLYDGCVSNTVLNNKNQTLIFHVYDLKI